MSAKFFVARVDFTDFRCSAQPKQSRPKANPQDDGHIAAPMSGKIVRLMAEVGGSVQEGDVLLVLSAMKMVSDAVDFQLPLNQSSCQ